VNSHPNNSKAFLIRYLIGFFSVTFGQSIFMYCSSSLYCVLLSSLLTYEPSVSTPLLDPLPSFLYLRIIPITGSVLGAVMGSLVGLPTFGCSLFHLLLLIPLVFGVFFSFYYRTSLRPLDQSLNDSVGVIESFLPVSHRPSVMPTPMTSHRILESQVIRIETENIQNPTPKSPINQNREVEVKEDEERAVMWDTTSEYTESDDDKEIDTFEEENENRKGEENVREGQNVEGGWLFSW
jgi:hypothetical protein